MFMFWGKRTSYTKRLLKARVRGEHETECEAQENHHFVPNSNSPESNPPRSCASLNSGIHFYAVAPSGEESASASASASAKESVRVARCKELLKSLKENQLEMLLAAVESYGANLGACVFVKRRRRGPGAGGGKNEAKILPEYTERTIIAEEETEAALQICATSPFSCSRQDRNPHNSQHHNHRSHNRRQRQIKDQELIGENDNNAECYQNNMINLEERIPSAATTTTLSTNTTRIGRLDRHHQHRSSRNSGSSNDRELPVDPHLLCCQIWRWPDLNNSSELKRLPVCHSANDPVDICCNPYHWSRLCKPESPPPPYCLIADRLRPEDRAPSEGDALLQRCGNTNSPPLPGSLTTNGEDQSGQREWCTLAYWELGGRVGRLYPVEPTTVNVFDSLLDGDGLCLSTLAENHGTSPAIQRTRSKIGLGLMLSQESDGVWAYNRSENPIFVNSPTLDDPESRTLLVYRVPPGFCLNIFDRAKTFQQHSYVPTSLGCPTAPTGYASGPVDVNSVRISFAKGWGPKYSRQEVTSCPCWLEVLLAPCR